MDITRDFHLQSENDSNNRPTGSGRRPYEPPVLTCYGSVSQLTQGTSVKNGEASRTAL